MQFSSFRRAIVSFVWVMGAFAVYTVCVVPWIEPQFAHSDEDAAESAASLASSSTDRYVRELKHLFPEGSWELGQPMVLRSDEVTVLMDNYQQLDDGSLRIDKCSIVLYGNRRNTSGDQSLPNERGPTILQAPEGAELVFDKPLDLRTGNMDGKPIGGRLVGQIRIYSAGGAANDDFELVTRDVQITAQRIWTKQPVAFRWGENSGAGRDLMITRAKSEGPSADSDGLLSELGIVQLQQLERLTLSFASGDMFASTASTAAKPGVTPQPVDTTEHVHVSCDGPLQFDLKGRIATVEDNVRISRQQAGRKPDSIRAAKLAMHMDYVQRPNQQPPNPNDKSAAAALSGPDAAGKTLSLTRIVATGNPIRIDVPSYNSFIETRKLEYDLGTGLLKLQGTRTDVGLPGDHTSSVYFRNTEHQIWAPSIDFVGGESPLSWRLLAGGPGVYQGKPPQGGGQQVRARWTDHLSLQPEGQQQVLRIDGNATIEATGLGNVACSTVEFWMRPETVVVPSNGMGPPTTETKLTPTRLVAIASAGKSCQINAGQIRGDLQKVTVVMTQEPSIVQQSNTPKRAASQAQNPNSRSPQLRAEPKASSTYRIHGGELTAWVDAGQQLRRIRLRGQSQIVEQTATGQQGFEMVGSSVDYEMDTNGKPNAILLGTPAVLTMPEMRLEGQKIQLSGTNNRITIPAVGALQMAVPVDLFASEKKSNAQAGATQLVDISWTGGLVFDGRSALLEEQVVIEGNELRFRTARLGVTLDRAIDLAAPSIKTTRPQVVRIVADGGVYAAARTRDEQGQPAYYQQLVTRDLDIDYQTGAAVATGPGWLATTMKGDRLAALTSQPETTNPANPPGVSSTLSQLSVAFGQQLSGNLHRKEAHLQNDVRTWFGAVDSWEERVDPVQPRPLRAQDLLMTCQELFVMESPTARPSKERRPIELLARGNTHVQSKEFEARGHQIKYAEEKDMLTLEGHQQQPAEVWSRNGASGQASLQGRARRIRYSPRTQEIDVQDAFGIDITQLPQNQR